MPPAWTSLTPALTQPSTDLPVQATSEGCMFCTFNGQLLSWVLYANGHPPLGAPNVKHVDVYQLMVDINAPRPIKFSVDVVQPFFGLCLYYLTRTQNQQHRYRLGSIFTGNYIRAYRVLQLCALHAGLGAPFPFCI